MQAAAVAFYAACVVGVLYCMIWGVGGKKR